MRNTMSIHCVWFCKGISTTNELLREREAVWLCSIDTNLHWIDHFDRYSMIKSNESWCKIRERERTNERAQTSIYFMNYLIICSVALGIPCFCIRFMVEELLLLLVSNLSFARFIWHCDFDRYFFSFLFYYTRIVFASFFEFVAVIPCCSLWPLWEFVSTRCKPFVWHQKTEQYEDNVQRIYMKATNREKRAGAKTETNNE